MYIHPSGGGNGSHVANTATRPCAPDAVLSRRVMHFRRSANRRSGHDDHDHWRHAGRRQRSHQQRPRTLHRGPASGVHGLPWLVWCSLARLVAKGASRGWDGNVPLGVTRSIIYRRLAKNSSIRSRSNQRLLRPFPAYTAPTRHHRRQAATSMARHTAPRPLR